MEPKPMENGRFALAIAHPGHEIRVHGWMMANRPRVYVLTDGSGQRSSSRLQSTRNLLDEADAPSGCLFGQFSDRQIYSQVLAGNERLFLDLSEQMAVDWVRHEIDWVLGDAYEGAIMTHDLWRGVIDRAVEIARAISGRRIENVGFSLEKNPVPRSGDDQTIHSIRHLDAAAWRTKLLAAESYAELRGEVQTAFATWGREAFQYETLLVQPSPRQRPDWATPPEYERHGERQVSAGVYTHVVRYREHVLPILKQLAEPVAARLPNAA